MRLRVLAAVLFLASCGPIGPVAQASPTRSVQASPAAASSLAGSLCRLPFVRNDTGRTAGFVWLPGGAWSPDPSAGIQAGFYSWRFGRWLPTDPSSVSQDGSHYAYSTPDWTIHDVDVATGIDRTVLTGPGQTSGVQILYYASQGIYFDHVVQGPQPGLWFLDPRTGSVQTV